MRNKINFDLIIFEKSFPFDLFNFRNWINRLNGKNIFSDFHLGSIYHIHIIDVNDIVFSYISIKLTNEDDYYYEIIDNLDLLNIQYDKLKQVNPYYKNYLKLYR